MVIRCTSLNKKQLAYLGQQCEQLQSKRPGRQSLIPGKITIVSSLQIVEYMSGIHQANCPLCTCRFFLRLDETNSGSKSSTCLTLLLRLRTRNAKPSPLQKSSWCGNSLSTTDNFILLKAFHKNHYVTRMFLRKFYLKTLASVLGIGTKLLIKSLQAVPSVLPREHVSCQSRNSEHFIKPEGLLPCTQKSANCPCRKPDESQSMNSHSVASRYVLIIQFNMPRVCKWSLPYTLSHKNTHIYHILRPSHPS